MVERQCAIASCHLFPSANSLHYFELWWLLQSYSCIGLTVSREKWPPFQSHFYMAFGGEREREMSSMHRHV